MAGKAVTILVVDDEEPIRFLCEDLLASLNYTVLAAPDGEAALETLREHPEIDIVISDLRMPGMDGLELTKRVREEFNGVDVVVLTGFASIESAVESMKLGAADFIRKPFNLNTLIASISKIVERRRLSADEGEATDGPSVDELLKSRIDELDQLKNEFITITSHELLTPLTPITGYIDTLREGGLGELSSDQRQALDEIHGEIEKLRRHIRNLLSIRDLQGSGAQFETSPGVDLRELVADAVHQVANWATERSIVVKTESTGDLEVTTDPERLSTVIVEVLTNAIKFSRDGGEIKVSVERQGPKVSIVVADNGVGIGEEDLPKIFDKFYQAHRGDSRGFEGIGIGLTVSRGIVEALGGTIDVDSDTDEGTSISVTLPVDD